MKRLLREYNTVKSRYVVVSRMSFKLIYLTKTGVTVLVDEKITIHFPVELSPKEIPFGICTLSCAR